MLWYCDLSLVTGSPRGNDEIVQVRSMCLSVTEWF